MSPFFITKADVMEALPERGNHNDLVSSYLLLNPLRMSKYSGSDTP